MVVSVLFRDWRRGHYAFTNTRDFVRLIWQTASPTWKFSGETFQSFGPAFDNPDHMAITIHNYRWRLARRKPSTIITSASLQKLPVIHRVPTASQRWKATPTALRIRTTSAYASVFHETPASPNISGGIV